MLFIRNDYEMNDRFLFMEKNPYDIFVRECPELASSFDSLVEVQRSMKGLDGKTKQLINIALQTAQRNKRGIRFHAAMAKGQGATRDEVIGAVVMNLHISGLASVLDGLPEAIEGYDS